MVLTVVDTVTASSFAQWNAIIYFHTTNGNTCNNALSEKCHARPLTYLWIAVSWVLLHFHHRWMLKSHIVSICSDCLSIPCAWVSMNIKFFYWVVNNPRFPRPNSYVPWCLIKMNGAAKCHFLTTVHKSWLKIEISVSHDEINTHYELNIYSHTLQFPLYQ